MCRKQNIRVCQQTSECVNNVAIDGGGGEAYQDEQSTDIAVQHVKTNEQNQRKILFNTAYLLFLDW